MNNSKKKYKVLFKGVILPGFDKTEVINNIHKLTNVPIDIITRKFFSGKTVVIRHSDDEQDSAKLMQSFSDAGIETRIEEVDITTLENNETHKNNLNSKRSYIKFSFTVLIITLSIFLYLTREEKSSPPGTEKEHSTPLLSKVSQNSPPLPGSKTALLMSSAKQPVPTEINANLKSEKHPALNEEAKQLTLSTKQESDESNSADKKVFSDSDILISQNPEINQHTIKSTAKENDIPDDISDKLVKKSITNRLSGDTFKATSTLQNAEYTSFSGYFYGDIPFDIAIDDIISTLNKDNPDYKDFSGEKTVSILSSKDRLKTINKSNNLELLNIGDVYFITNNGKIVSISLDKLFLFKDTPYIHGSYNIRIFPVIKQKFPLFLSKFINNFNNKKHTWWENHIKPFEDVSKNKTVTIKDNKYTIIIKFAPKVSLYTDFFLSDYANKPIYNDRLSVTIVRTSF